MNLFQDDSGGNYFFKKIMAQNDVAIRFSDVSFEHDSGIKLKSDFG